MNEADYYYPGQRYYSNGGVTSRSPNVSPLLHTTPMPPLRLRPRHRRSSASSRPSSISPPSRSWKPHAACAAATEHARYAPGCSPRRTRTTCSTNRRGMSLRSVQERPLNNLLPALSRALAAGACGDGPTGHSLFSCLSQGCLPPRCSVRCTFLPEFFSAA